MGKKIGLCVMFRLDKGGGAPRLIVDLINVLNELGHEVHLLTPFELDYPKISEIYEPIKVKKVYHLSKLKSMFCRESTLARKLLKEKFKQMSKEVDMIIDIDGGILHNYLPKNFKKSKYIVWRFAGIDSSEDKKINKTYKRAIKDFIKKILFLNQTRFRHRLNDDYRIYAIDEWTRDRLIQNWGLRVKEVLFHAIHVKDFLYKGQLKKNQIVNLGRFIEHRRVEDAIYLFSRVQENFKGHTLILIGGSTSNSKSYIKYLKNFAKRQGVFNRIKFIVNPSFKEIQKTLRESKILLDTQLDISAKMPAIEAMAAGCVVITPKSCGTYHEVLMDGKIGYGFSSLREGSEKLRLILDKLDKNKINPKEFIKRADFYSLNNFKEKLKEIIEYG